MSVIREMRGQDDLSLSKSKKERLAVSSKHKPSASFTGKLEAANNSVTLSSGRALSPKPNANAQKGQQESLVNSSSAKPALGNSAAIPPAAKSLLPLDFDFSQRIEELKQQLEAGKSREKELDKDLQAMMQKNHEIPRQMSLSLNRMKTQLALVESDSSQLCSMLSLTLVLAENISGKVRELDLAKGRVVEALQRVEDILDLKLCTEGVQSALQNEDYEQAAGHIHRFLTLDDAVLNLSEEFAADSAVVYEDEVFAEEDAKKRQRKPSTGGSLKQSFAVLKNAEATLKETISVKFDEAVASGDVASMERFFKIFPLLKQHDLGLEKFSAYLSTKIAARGESAYKTYVVAGGMIDARSNVLYADALTMLFEDIAKIFEIHQPLVETYYGPERILTLVQYLQKECDVQTQRIIAEFLRQRQYDRKAKLIDTYARNASKYATMEKLDPLELDTLLSEVALMHTRCELYFRFLRRRVKADIGLLPESDPRKTQFYADLDSLLKNCQLSRTMQELICQYIAMEEYFMRESVKKAVQLDVREPGQLCSSMVDDVFFLVKKCIRRSLSSSSVDGVCAMLNNACCMLEEDYRNTIMARLKAGYPLAGSLAEAYTTAAAAYTSVIQQGKLASGSSESAEKAREAFMTAMNNADVSREYAQQLKDSLWADIQKHLGQVTEQDKKKLEMCLGNMEECIQKFKQSIAFGIDQLVTAAIVPRLKPWVDAFNNYTHTPTESEFNEFEVNDPFVKNFLSSLDGMFRAYKDQITDSNYEMLVGRVSGEIATRLEKAVLKATFNRLGGLHFDKETRDLAAYLASIASWTLREKFARLTQIAMLLNVESLDEVKELYNSPSITWRLTPNEVRQMLALRVDLSAEDTRRLKL